MIYEFVTERQGLVRLGVDMRARVAALQTTSVLTSYDLGRLLVDVQAAMDVLEQAEEEYLRELDDGSGNLPDDRDLDDNKLF